MAYSRMMVFYHKNDDLERILSALCEDSAAINQFLDGYYIHSSNVASLNEVELDLFDGIITQDNVLIDKESIAMSHLNATATELSHIISSLASRYYRIMESCDLLVADVSFHF